MTRDVVVFLEPSGEKSRALNEGLLTEGRRISSALGGSLSAMAVGPFTEEPPCTLYHVEGEGLSRYSAEAFAWASARALSGIPFRLLLFAHTDRGSELAPRVAFSLSRHAVTDCVDLGVRDGVLFYVRSVYGDRLQQEVSYSSPGREIASMRCDALDEREPKAEGEPRVVPIAVDVPLDLARSSVTEIVPPDYRTVDVAFAKRIVGVGSGCCALLGLVDELCSILEGSVAATRPVADDGLLPKERMIGRTGKTVAPLVYLALGISGSPHHVAGIQKSRCILSVNRDPGAPIFNVADGAFVADLHSLLPRLIERIKRYRDAR